MKRLILIAAIAVGIITLFQFNALAYSVLWGTWDYYSETTARAGDVLDNDYTYSSDFISSTAIKYNAQGNPVAEGYSEADSMPQKAKASSSARSRLGRIAGGHSEVLLHNTFTIVGGPLHTIIPTYLSAHLKGVLFNNEINGTAYSQVRAGIWSMGDWRLVFEEELDGDGLRFIDEDDGTMLYPRFGHTYNIIAGLQTKARTQDLASALSEFFHPGCFGASFHLTPIPEPTTILLFGIGLLGAGILNRKRKI